MSPVGEIESLLRDLAPQVLAVITHRYGDFFAAEDAVQEALIAASTQWPTEGLPHHPRGWLIHVASRRMLDHLRSELARQHRELEVAKEASASVSGDASSDDTLQLLLMCCHPALTMSSAIALTLRAVGGLTTNEIARVYMVPEATMAQRISRAKRLIKESDIPFELPAPAEQRQRLRAVLHILYLIFSEGYTSSSGTSLHRVEMAQEAIRLTRRVHQSLPNDGEIMGLLALMLLTDARRYARTDADGALVPLLEQDRSLWDQAQIVEGVALVSAALSQGSIGIYQLQAAIAAVHDEASRPEDTDWPQILALYGLLKQMTDNPMVTLSHAIAVAMVHGPPTGLVLLEQISDEGRLAESHRLDAARAHLLEMNGQHKAAIENYRLAAERTTSIPERHYLILKAARLREATMSQPETTITGLEQD